MPFQKGMVLRLFLSRLRCWLRKNIDDPQILFRRIDRAACRGDDFRILPFDLPELLGRHEADGSARFFGQQHPGDGTRRTGHGLNSRHFAHRHVVKLRLEPPSDTPGADGESSLLGGRVAAATKTASKAERDENLLHWLRHGL